MRISGVVAAIKGFTHMDQAMVAEPVDLIQGLSNTVAVLKSKARAKSAAVVVVAEPGLPRVRGFAGELNQIWGNLIDNALDAVTDSGRVEVVAKREQQGVAVHIIDNGPGIPAHVLPNLFEAFVSTRLDAKGTGLGLTVAEGIVSQHGGTISASNCPEGGAGEIGVESQPGRTDFRVALPIADSEGTGVAN